MGLVNKELEMNKDIARRWVTALRSGEYEQTERRLRKGTKKLGHCCLGVLCDLHSKETGTPWDREENTYLGEHGNLPQEVIKWAGMLNSGCLPDTVDGFGSLTSLNDYSNYAFKKIADVIEAQGDRL